MSNRDRIELHGDDSSNKLIRDQSRWLRLNHANLALKQHFINAGDSPTQAKSKVNQLSTEVSEMGGEPIFNYIMGNKQPLKTKINSSALPFMNGTAKGIIVDKL